MRDAVELAAQFIRSGDYVLANDVLKDEYKRPGQAVYLAIYRDNPGARAINESLSCMDV